MLVHVVETIKEINKIRDTFVDEEKLKNAKAKYVGDFVLALERPSTRSDIIKS